MPLLVHFLGACDGYELGLKLRVWVMFSFTAGTASIGASADGWVVHLRGASTSLR